MPLNQNRFQEDEWEDINSEDEWEDIPPTRALTPVQGENIRVLTGVAKEAGKGLAGIPGSLVKLAQTIGAKSRKGLARLVGIGFPKAGKALEEIYEAYEGVPSIIPTEKQIEEYLPESFRKYTEPRGRMEKFAQSAVRRAGRGFGNWLTFGGSWMTPLLGSGVGGVTEAVTGSERAGDWADIATNFAVPAARFSRAKLRAPGVGGKLNVIKDAKQFRHRLENAQSEMGNEIKDYLKDKKVTGSQQSYNSLDEIRIRLKETAGQEGTEKLSRELNKTLKIFKKPITGVRKVKIKEPSKILGPTGEPLEITKIKQVPRTSKQFKINAEQLNDNIRGYNEIIFNPKNSQNVIDKALKGRNILKQELTKAMDPEMIKKYDTFNDISQGLFNMDKNMDAVKAVKEATRTPEGYRFLMYLGGHLVLNGKYGKLGALMATAGGGKAFKDWYKLNKQSQDVIVSAMEKSPEAKKIWQELMRSFEEGNAALIKKNIFYLGQLISSLMGR